MILINTSIKTSSLFKFDLYLHQFTKLIYLLLAAFIMRIGDYNVKPTNKDHAESYDSENN
jgi:hypothetical protein